MRRNAVLALLLPLWAAPALGAQEFGHHSLTENHATTTQQVEYVGVETMHLAAGKPTTIELRLRVRDGLHINSHRPSSEYLIPTVLTLPAGSGLTLERVDYPAGTDVSLPVDPKTKLNVYSGEFTLVAHVVAQPGEHAVTADLHYQACDNNACMPARHLPVVLDVVVR